MSNPLSHVSVLTGGSDPCAFLSRHLMRSRKAADYKVLCMIYFLFSFPVMCCVFTLTVDFFLSLSLQQIRIRDPNQGGRDITEEIMSGGRSGSTPTPPQVSYDTGIWTNQRQQSGHASMLLHYILRVIFGKL